MSECVADLRDVKQVSFRLGPVNAEREAQPNPGPKCADWTPLSDKPVKEFAPLVVDKPRPYRRLDARVQKRGANNGCGPVVSGIYLASMASRTSWEPVIQIIFGL